MEILIVGAGLSGAIVANKFAKKGKKVLVIEKKKHVAGNVYDRKIAGITTHMYGPHVFHTDNEKVYKYMNKFWTLNNYEHQVEAKVEDMAIPLPFNFTGIDRFFVEEAEELKQKLTSEYGKNSRITLNELSNNLDPQIRKVYDFIFKNIYENFTQKMWGLDIEKIDPEVINRVPIAIGYKTNFYSDKYQGLPVEGYTKTIKKMLEHKNITVRTGVNIKTMFEMKDGKIFIDNIEIKCPIVYTGSLDELFDYQYGDLPFRSLKFEYIEEPVKRYQTSPVVNLPSDEEITRTTEYKQMTMEKTDTTIISKEIPGEYDQDGAEFHTPHYPMPTEDSRKQYEEYHKLVQKYPNIYPLGRLANFKHIDMEHTILNALDLADKLLD